MILVTHSSRTPQTVLVFYTFVGSSQLAEHLANEINQGPYYVKKETPTYINYLMIHTVTL